MNNNIRNIIILLITGLLISQTGFSQSKKTLERKRRKTQKEIAYTNKLLKETKKSQKNSYNQLVILNNKINKRKELISTIKSEIELLTQRINENEEVVKSLQNDINDLKKEYAKMIYYAYKMRNNYDKLIFILASRDINQAYKRFIYLQEYTEYRKKQVKAIIETQKILESKILELKKSKEQKTELIKAQQTETVSLTIEKSEQNKVLESLKQKERTLLKKLQKKEREAAKLKAQIQKIIAEEARKARANKKATKKSKKGYSLTPEEKIISDNFGANKGRLPWPVKRGIITGKYGKHEHPVLKGIMVMNNGVNISTTQNSVARAVFKGKVTSIINLSATNKAVMIRHGNYFTVYTNLKSVYVAVGDNVKAKQDIGLIYTDKDDGNKTVVQFQIWKGGVKLNPELWLAKHH